MWSKITYLLTMMSVICAVPEPSMAIYQDVTKACVYEHTLSLFNFQYVLY